MCRNGHTERETLRAAGGSRTAAFVTADGVSCASRNARPIALMRPEAGAAHLQTSGHTFLDKNLLKTNQQGNPRNFARYRTGARGGETLMRTSVLALIVIAGSSIASQATAQPQQAAPSELTKEQIDKGVQTSQPNLEADKGVKTRDQAKPGASAHPPGRPDSQQTR